MIAESRAQRPWISKRRALQLLQVGPKRLAELAVAGHVRFHAVPGGWTRYLRDDVERLAQPAELTKQPA